MNFVKWSGTILCLVGIGFTSFNIYPINIFLSLIGSGLWTYAGYKQSDFALFLVELVAVLFYLVGAITWALR